MMGKFTKNILITFIAQILQLGLLLGASIIIARVLGPEGKGIYSLAILLPVLLITFTNLGIGSASVYYIGKKQYSPKEVFGANIIFSVLISTFTILVGLIVIFFFGDKVFPSIPQKYLLLTLSLIPFQFFLTFALSVLLGLQKIKKYNIIQLIQSLIFLILIIIFLLGFRFGIGAAIIAQIVSLIIACIIIFLQVKKHTSGLIFLLTKPIIKDFFSYGVKVYLSNIFSFLHYRIDQLMLNMFINPVAVGFYSVAAALSEKIWLISQSAGTVLFPRACSSNTETAKRDINKITPLVCRNILFITLLMAIFLFLIGHWLITLLYSEQFSASILPFQILLIGAVTISGWRILANDLSGRGKPMLNTHITSSSAILNIILNVLWIPKFGISGAAWATSISYTIALIIITVVYSKISDNKIKDIIFIKKSDFKYYKNFILIFKNKYFNSKNNL